MTDTIVISIISVSFVHVILFPSAQQYQLTAKDRDGKAKKGKKGKKKGKKGKKKKVL